MTHTTPEVLESSLRYMMPSGDLVSSRQIFFPSADEDLIFLFFHLLAAEDLYFFIWPFLQRPKI